MREGSIYNWRCISIFLFLVVITFCTLETLKQHRAASYSSRKLEREVGDALFDLPSLSEIKELKSIKGGTDNSISETNNRAEDDHSGKSDEKRESSKSSITNEESADDVGKPLNILLLYADDWRHDTLGAAGNAVVKTPVLDKLVSNGVHFRQNCVTTSICWISRATLYSGMYLARHKFEMLGRGRTVNGKQMGYEPPKNETIYALLKHKAGYHVGHSGKLGLWLDIEQHINTDYFVDEDGWHWTERGGKKIHITEKNTNDAIEFLNRRPKDKPFFLNVAYFATHAVDGDENQYLPQNQSMKLYIDESVPIPETATEEAWRKMPYFFGQYNEGRTRWRWRFDTPEKHQRMMKNYYRMATEVDSSVGVILEKLKEQNVLDNTLIIFTTDNGNFHAEHGLADKWYPHQESIRVPLIISDPRISPEYVGTTNDDFTLNIDLAPTILSAAGLQPLPSMMGRDMSILYRKDKESLEGNPLTISKESQRRRRRRLSSSLTSQEGRDRKYLPPAEDGNGKYHTGTDSSWRTEFFYEHPTHTNRDFIPASEALVRKDYKYFYWPDFHYEQLFDIRNDPGEMNDLVNSTAHQNILNDMRNRFQQLKLLAHSDSAMIF